MKWKDSSWLVNGDIGIERLKSALAIDDKLPGEEEKTFYTPPIGRS